MLFPLHVRFELSPFDWGDRWSEAQCSEVNLLHAHFARCVAISVSVLALRFGILNSLTVCGVRAIEIMPTLAMFDAAELAQRIAGRKSPPTPPNRKRTRLNSSHVR